MGQPIISFNGGEFAMKEIRLYIVPTKGTTLSFYDLMHKFVRENKGIPDDEIDDYLKSHGIILVRARERE